MNLRRLVLIAICLSTAFGLISAVNGWPKTASVCGVIVVLLSACFLTVENWARRRLRDQQE